MKLRLKASHLIAVAVCALLIGSLLISISSRTPRIMVLHSNSIDHVWTSLITHSINDIFRRSQLDVKIRYFHLNANLANYAQRVDSTEQSFVELIERFGPQVIIAVGDVAQGIIAKHYVDHPGISVIFAGVSDSIGQYGYENGDNVTGVFGHKPVYAIKRAIAELESFAEDESAQPVDVLFLADDSVTSRNDASFLMAQMWGDVAYHGAKHVADFAQWRKFIAEESGKYDYILVSGYRNLRTESGYADPGDVAKWTQANSKAGVIGMNAFNSEDGILVSVGVSPYEQGSIALKMALQIISGESVSEISYHYPEKYILAISEEALYDQEVQQNYKQLLLRHATDL